MARIIFAVPFISFGLMKLKFLNVFLAGVVKYCKLPMCARGQNFFWLGWGRKRSFLIAKIFAYMSIGRVTCLEDGFIRSYNVGNNFPSVALIADDLGIYYDCAQENALEKFLSKDSNFFTKNNYFYQKICTEILNFKISKYNHAPKLNDKTLRSKDICRILVIDQTFGDSSIESGQASKESFREMAHVALLENPSATIYVKTHPEVTSGRKKGYLTDIQNSDRIVIIRDDVNPIDLIQQMDKVYVVTSQMGFEALICGKPVVTFGVPWYAGWGLTDDRVKDSPAWARRTKKRTVDELFAAAYIDYTRYLNPFTHQRGTIFDVIEWLILQKKMASRPFTRDFGGSTH